MCAMPPVSVEEPVTGYNFLRSNESYGSAISRNVLTMAGLALGVWFFAWAQSSGVPIVNQLMANVPVVGNNLQTSAGTSVI